MSKLSKGSLLLVCTAASLPVTASANSLLDAYKEARAHDATLAAALHARDAAVEARPQAWAGYLPQLSASGNIQREKQDYLSVRSSLLRSGQTFYSTNKSWSVTLTQAIWSYQSYEQLRESAVQVAQAENTYENAQQSLVLRVAQAYFNVLSAQDTVRADIAARDAYKSQLKQAQKQFQVGTAAITDVEPAQASYDSSVATLIADRRTLSNAKQALAVITGVYHEQVAPLRKDIPLAPPSPDDVGAWVAAAKKDNLNLRGAQLQYQVAKRDIGVQRAGYFPSLNLQGSVGQNQSGGQFGSDTRDYLIGLQLSVPIFEGGLTQSKVRQAVATAAEYQSQYVGQKRTTVQQTRDAFEGVISGVASVKALKQAVKSNQTALKAAEVGLQVGTRNVVDVITAQQNLYLALKNYYQSRYGYLESVLSLKQQAGRLSEGDLAKIDDMLAASTTPPPPPEMPTAPNVNAPGNAAAGATDSGHRPSRPKPSPQH